MIKCGKENKIYFNGAIEVNSATRFIPMVPQDLFQHLIRFISAALQDLLQPCYKLMYFNSVRSISMALQDLFQSIYMVYFNGAKGFVTMVL